LSSIFAVGLVSSSCSMSRSTGSTGPRDRLQAAVTALIRGWCGPTGHELNSGERSWLTAAPGAGAIISAPVASPILRGSAAIGEMPMHRPDTTLDAEYSDPAASATGWEEARHVLATAELFWICSARPDGRPHVTPVVAVWADEAIWFSTGAGEVKFANLGANPHVVLVAGANRWDQGLDVVVEGDAVQVTDDAVLARVAAQFPAKWDGRWKFRAQGGAFRDPEHGDGEALVFSVRPVKVFAHDKGDPFGMTRHQFPVAR
jgi:Pyridoxamine 5'-phosphate oxidase